MLSTKDVYMWEEYNSCLYVFKYDLNTGAEIIRLFRGDRSSFVGIKNCARDAGDKRPELTKQRDKMLE